MRIVDAIWEKRNLGVSSLEINIEDGDSVDDCLKRLKKQQADYIVVKIPTKMSEFVFFIQELGFVYIEDMVHLVSDLRMSERTALEERMYNSVTTQIMDESDVENLLIEVKKGLFDTDRISLDPFFTKEQATNRYVNWIKDERSRGTVYFNYIYKGNKVGFVSLREEKDGVYSSVLGGIYPEYRNSAIGAVVKVVDIVRSYGGKKIETNVSTNNPAQIRNLIKSGFMPTEIVHVFVLHGGLQDE